MYRDVVQWLKVRHQVLVEGIPQRQIARETGISPKTIRKMLAHPHPQPYGPRNHRYSKLGPTYRLNPTDAPGERYPAAHGSSFHPGHVREHPRSRGV
jgi:hypothetical protein